MTVFQAVVFLLFGCILAAGLFQFSSISLSPIDPARGEEKAVAKEQDLDTRLVVAGEGARCSWGEAFHTLLCLSRALPVHSAGLDTRAASLAYPKRVLLVEGLRDLHSASVR